MASGNKDFGKHIKYLREKKNLTQEMLAEKVDLEFQTISRIETGLYFTSYENLVKLSKALEVDLKDLFDYKDTVQDKKELLKMINSNLKQKTIADLQVIHEIIKSLDSMNATKQKIKRCK